MAHKKGQGSTRNGRDSNPQYRGVKKYDGELVKGGSIIVRQVGSHFHPGQNVGQGRDYTLYSTIEGRVRFEIRNRRRFISVTPLEAAAE
ncbi:MAG TPA: 50S ribosomal protein L27 [Deltaproteobacteria bacterium]|nr:50S ribosomal protein L27 [Deltaproteobacteria bacterium]